MVTHTLAAAFFATRLLAPVLANSCPLALFAVVLDSTMFADAATTAVLASVLMSSMHADAHASTLLAQRLAAPVRALTAHAAVFFHGGNDTAAVAHGGEAIGIYNSIRNFFDLDTLGNHVCRF